MTDRGMVIVGAGEAGTAAALALRDGGYAGPVTLIGEEPHPPYERPPLSKAVMLSVEPPALPAIGRGARFADRSIEHLAGVRVAALDRYSRVVHLEDGRMLPYEALLLATGARPRRLSTDGADSVHYLRTFADAVRLRRCIEAGRRVVVIGGGFIGLELAAGARERGATVTIIEAAPRILTRGVPAEIAGVIAARHRAAGVDLIEGIGLAALEARDDGTDVVLADGRRIAADVVIAGIGAVPEVGLAADSGLPIDNGIAVDRRLATSDPHVFAAGDCCSFPHPLYRHRRIRLEAWRNAADQGAAAARSMLGSQEPFSTVPWFWSDQYDLHLQIAGLVDEGPTTIRRDLGGEAVLLFHLAADGCLMAASGVGPIGSIAKEIRLAEMLIARAARPDPAALAMPGVKLKSLLAA